MEYLLRPRHALLIWERRPQGGARPMDLEAAAAQSDFVLFCLPAGPHFELAARLRPALRESCVCLSIAKGVDDEGRTAAQALTQALAGRASGAVLYGPMIAEEIRAGKPAFAQCGAARRDDCVRARALFHGTPLTLDYTADVTGISWSAVLKNVYAILFGAADELGLGDNIRGYLAVAALQEIDRIVRGLGGAAGTPYHLAGLGDLITTATSAGSHHHELGRRLARGAEEAPRGEGVHTLATVRARRLFDTGPYPLFNLIGRMLDEPRAAAAAMRGFLDRVRRGDEQADRGPA